MRILITGHKGYIGTVMAPLLADAGHEVVGLDSDLFEQCTFGEAPREYPSIRKDLRDVEHSDLEGFDAVIHLAGLSNDPLGNLNPNLTYDINHHASVRLARLSKEVGVKRFLFSSSCSTYGAAGDKILDETAEFNPVTPYGCTIQFAADAGPDKRCYRVDFSRIARILPAFQPKWDARRGARELYSAYKKVSLCVDDFEGPRYKRIDHIQGLLTSGRLKADLRWQTVRSERELQSKG